MVATKLFEPGAGRMRVDRYELVGEIASGGAILWISQTDGARFPSLEHVPLSRGNRFWIDLEALVSGPEYDAARQWHRRVIQQESFCLHLCVDSSKHGKKWAIWPDGSRLCDNKCPLSIAHVAFDKQRGNNKLVVITKTPFQHRVVEMDPTEASIFELGRRTASEIKKIFKGRPGGWHPRFTIIWQCGFERFNSQTLKKWIELNPEEKIAREQVVQSKGFCGALHGPGDDSFCSLLKYECRHSARSSEKRIIHACEKCAVRWQKEYSCMACPECITPLGQNAAMYERDELGYKRRKLLRPKYLDSVWK